MSDRIRILRLLREAGPTGVRSLELRRAGYSGNPSQRVRELKAEGHIITATAYRDRSGRRGKKYVLEFSPSDAVIDSAGGGSSGVSGGRLRPAVARGVAQAGSSSPPHTDGPALFDMSPEPRGYADPEWEAA